MSRAKKFGQDVIEWHDRENDREMPWKGESDPYKIWLSEIILQQTRVIQGTHYYQTFTTEFPTVHDLARAPLDKVLQLWEGLGYYNRARNLHATAQYISSERHGQFPKTYEGLLKLKGVGPYTAAAIASFAFSLPHPVLDGNSLRLVMRFEDCDIPIDKQKGKFFVQQFLEKAIPTDRPAHFNQALMDLGATICSPGTPACSICPLSTKCIANKKNTISERPVKKKKLKRKHRYFHFLFWRYKGSVAIEKRREKDIWQDLYQLPLLEGSDAKPPAIPDLAKHLCIPADRLRIDFVHESRQLLSHQEIHAYFYLLQSNTQPTQSQNVEWVAESDLPSYGVPKVVRDFLNAKQGSLF